MRGDDVVLSLNNITECDTIFWNKSIYIMNNCTRYNPVNDTMDNYSCYDLDVIQLNKTTCETVGYEINNITNISFKDFGACNYKLTGKPSIIVVCDSKYDGNGDGVCHSGESCIRYIISESKVKIEYRNSELNFSEENHSFKRIDKIKLKTKQ